MSRRLKRVLWAFGGIVGIPVLAGLLLYLLADTWPGQWSIAGLTWLLTRGHISITGLDGTFPDALKARHVEIADEQGVWLVLDDVAIDWQPWGFLSDNVAVKFAHARHGTWLRLPISTHRNLPPDTTRYDIAEIVIDRADFAAWLAGRPFTLGLRARGHYTNENDAQWVIDAAGGGGGRYHSEGTIDAQQFTATLTVREPAHGFLAGLVGLPNAGATAVDARVWGPRAAENLDATVHTGTAVVRAVGGFDLNARSANLDVSGSSGAMAPRRDLSWDAFTLEGHLRGSFSRPEATGHLSISNFRLSGAGARTITGDLTGSGGTLHFTGTAEGTQIPGREPNVLAATPLALTVDADVDRAAPLLVFHGTHPLVNLNGRATLDAHTVVDATLRLKRVAPFAQLGGVDIDGDAALTAHVDTAAEADVYAVSGVVNAAGPALLSRVVGRNAHVDFAMRRSGSGLAIDRAHIQSPTLTLDAQGSQQSDTLDFTYTAKLADMSRVLSTLVGSLSSEGRIQGAAKDFAVNATADGTLATKGYAQGPVNLTLVATHVPGNATGTLDARGQFDSAPLRLSAAFDPRGGGFHHIVVKTLEWRSVRANGDFTVPANFRSAAGHSEVHIAQLSDVGLLIGQAIKGALHGTVDLANESGRTTTRINANASGLAVAGITAQSLGIEGRIGDPLGKPDAALTLKAGGLVVAGVAGDATAQVNGPFTAMHVALAGDFKNGGDAIPLVADATLDFDAKAATLARFETTYRGEPFRLTAPAHVAFANGGLAVDRLLLLSNSAEIAFAGRIRPELAATLTLRNASPELVNIFVPSLDAEGTLSGDAKLAGTLDAPKGAYSLRATGVKLRGVTSGLPPATITADGALYGKTVSVTAHIDAGSTAHLKLDGTVPLQSTAAFDLAADGTIDLAVTDPILTADGRRLRGLVSLDGHITGTFDQPRATGSAVLSGGEFDDFLQGVRVNNIAAHLDAKGNTITINNLTGRAGHGTISGSGTIALWAAGKPLDLNITLKNARPVATDLFTADLDATLKLTGRLDETLTLSGTARINRGDINIAESYPSSVAVLDVRRSRNAPAPPKPPKPLSINLDLMVTAANRIYVRGRGLDAETGGTLNVKGSSTAPIVTGGFTLKRGDLSLGGATVRFTSGKLTFDGRSLNGSFDPALDFAAESTAAGVAAKLSIGGHASTPTISLSSTPSLPQDEVLAHLLFGRSISQLSPLELAQIAQAFAALGGFGGGFNPLGVVRRTLGLDRLAVGSAASGNGATIEVGKNIGHSIYIGAKQDTSGGSQAVVQVDLTEHLKLQTTVTAVPSAAPTVPTATPQENGNSIGLTYEFEY